MKNLFAALVLAGAGLFPSAGHAQNYFTNSSFEIPSAGTGGGPYGNYLVLTNDGLANGWTWTTTNGGQGGVSAAGNFISSTTPAPDGAQYGFQLWGGTMSQVITVPTNGIYGLTFYAGTASTAFPAENLALQVNGVTLNYWTNTFFGTALQLIVTNISLVAGPNTVSFVCDTNGAATGSSGMGLTFDLVQTGPYYTGFTVVTNALSVISDGSYQGTLNGLNYLEGQAASGWTLVVGTNGGVYTWSNSLVVSSPYPVTITGANATNLTTILFNTADYDGIYAQTPFTTVENFAFNWTNNSPAAFVQITGSNVCYRISNCNFLGVPNKDGGGFAVDIGNNNSTAYAPGPFGLVDHCTWNWPGSRSLNYCHVRYNGDLSNGVPSQWGWTQPMTWGTTNVACFEDCTATASDANGAHHFVEAQSAARICIRYCNFTNVEEGTHGIADGDKVGTCQVELYENNFFFNDTNNTAPYCFWTRGGTCVCWSNTVADTSYWNLSQVCRFTVECAESGNWTAEGCPSLLVYPADYPGPEQVGQGVVGGVPGTVPCYCWSNNFCSTYYGDYVLGIAEDNSFIVQGRDIFTNQPMPSYTPLVYPHPLAVAVPSGVAPTITQQPANATYVLGQTAYFSVSAAGTVPLSFQWLTNGVAAGGFTSSSFAPSAAAVGTMTVSCQVSNAYGSAMSATAILTVVSAQPHLGAGGTNTTPAAIITHVIP